VQGDLDSFLNYLCIRQTPGTDKLPGNIIITLLSGVGSHFWACLQNCERQPLASSCLSILPSAWKNLALTGRIFVKFDI